MSSIVDSLPTILVIALAIVSFVLGILFLVLFARRRKILFLILGLLLTFILPGVFLCLACLLWLPNAAVVYGPPPTIMVYGPPPSNRIP
jgi:hypothetical protein